MKKRSIYIYIYTCRKRDKTARGYARLTDNGLLPCRVHLPRGHLRFLRRVACHLGVAGDKILPLARLTVSCTWRTRFPPPSSFFMIDSVLFFLSLCRAITPILRKPVRTGKHRWTKQSFLPSHTSGTSRCLRTSSTRR